MTLVSRSITARKPGPLLNMNDRRHRYNQYRENQNWKDAAFWWAKQHKLRCHTDGIVDVWVEFGTKRPNQRRDPHNFAPTVKAICDGFTLAAVWPDDDSKHVHTVEPTFTIEIPDDSLRVTLTWITRE